MMEQHQVQDNAKSEVTEKVNNVEQKQQQTSGMKKIGFGVIGFIIGGPISYFFQHAAIREKIPFGRYIIESFKILLDPTSWKSDSMVGNVGLKIFLTCVICAAIGCYIGYSMDKKNNSKA